MIYTNAQYEILKAAYVQGVLSVRFGDKEIVYRSKREMKEILDEIEGGLGLNSRSNRTKYISFKKGLQ